ncbi:MAG TPA: hypothetical protein VGD62_07530 [Acidobacteriaceae bacterium]
MTLHPDTHALHSTLGAIKLPGDLIYKGAILAVAILLLLTAGL